MPSLPQKPSPISHFLQCSGRSGSFVPAVPENIPTLSNAQFLYFTDISSSSSSSSNISTFNELLILLFVS